MVKIIKNNYVSIVYSILSKVYTFRAIYITFKMLLKKCCFQGIYKGIVIEVVDSTEHYVRGPGYGSWIGRLFGRKKFIT